MKYILLTTFVLVIGLVIAQVVIKKSTEGTKKIPYKTLQCYEEFTIREYPELIVATTELNGSNYKSISRSGFGKIAGYIFGNNSADQQIAMTSPVQMDMGSSKSMSFYMPLEYNLDNLPAPNSSDVTLTTQSSSVVAAISFSGWASDEVLEIQFLKLKKLLLDNNIDFEDEYTYLGYNPPYQIMNRRNEIVIKLKNYYS